MNMKRMLAILLAAVMALGLTSVSADAEKAYQGKELVVATWGWTAAQVKALAKDFEEATGCTVIIDSDGKGPRRGDVGIEPGFLPEGYTLVYHSTISNKSIFFYGHKNTLTYSYLNLDISVTDLSNYEIHQKIEHFTNESIDTELIEIRGCTGYYITNGSCKYVIWIEDNYFIQVRGYITREEIVKTAQNLTVYESKK